MATFDYGEATSKLIKYWEKYHEDYQTLVPRYWELIREKEAHNYVLHNSRDGAILRDFPRDIELLEMVNRRAAIDYIDDLTPGQLKRAIIEIENKVAHECSCFNLLKKRVKYHQNDIKDQKRPKKYVYGITHITI